MSHMQALFYLPVLHRGYIDFLQRNHVQAVGVLGSSILADFPQLKKDIRALEPSVAAAALSVILPDVTVTVVEKDQLAAFNRAGQSMVMPEDEVMHELAKTYLPQVSVIYDTVFLRWDRQKSLEEQHIESSTVLSEAAFDQEMIAKALSEAEKSTDWWRRVGAAIVKDGRVLEMAFNRHLPDAQQPYYDGDPRADFHRGEHIDKSTAIHAEAFAIAQAAKEGNSLEGADLYVTTFPCPTCAKLIAFSGVKKLYFKDGYAMVDGEEVLKDQGVEIIRVVSSGQAT